MRSIMVVAALLLAVGTAGADDEPKASAPPPLTAAVLAEAWDLGETLRRAEVAAMSHADRARVDEAERVAITTGLVEGVIARRQQLAAALSARVPEGESKLRPRLVHLLGDLHMDQHTSMVRLGAMRGQEPEDTGADQQRALAVAWYERLLAEDPKYPRLGQILDLMSQHYFDAGSHDKAKLALQRMLCANRDDDLTQLQAAQDKADNIYQQRVYSQSVTITSYRGCTPRPRDRELVDDGWMRLGWLHRANASELGLAVSAYEQAADDPASPSYFVALQELAATYYDSGQLIDAIPPLDRLIEYLDRLARTRPDEFDDTLFEVRTEAVARSAGILAELWRESALPVADASLELANIYFRGRGQGHVRDVFEELGAALRGIGAFEQATTVWAHMLVRWPVHPRAPLVHDRLVELLVETGNPSAADRERERLVAAFDGATPWRTHNRADPRALRRAEEIVADTLHALSSSAFRVAQLRFQSAPGAAPTAADRAVYDRAAALARRVVDRFPSRARGYDAAFQLAQLEFYRGDHLAAARRARWLNQRDPVGKHAIDATRLMLDAYQKALEVAVADKTVTLPPLPDLTALQKQPAAVALPDVVAEVRKAHDDFASEVSSPALAADALVTAADLSLRYYRVSEAETRYRTVVREHCQTARAHVAATRLQLIGSARGAQTLGERAQDLLNRACGANAPVQLVRRARVKKLLVEAARLRAADRHLEAGRSYFQAHRNSSSKDAEYATSLIAAGEAFSAAGRNEVTVKILAPFLTDPALASHKVAPRARWQVAQAHEAGFAYDQAVDAYLGLAGYTGAAEPGFDLPARKLEALWRAAELREVDRVYYDRGTDDPGAATLFLRYAREVARDRARASEAHLRAAKVYELAGDPNRLEATFRAWQAAHGKSRAVAHHAVHFHHAVAVTRLAAGDRRGAATAFREVVDAHRALGGKRGDAETALAAEAAFWRADDAFQRDLRAHVFAWPEDGDTARSEARIEALARVLSAVERQFKVVSDLGTDWSVAAQVRIGDCYLEVWRKMIDAPVPRSLIAKVKGGGIESLEAFSEEIRGALKPVLDQAGERWVAARDLGRSRGVSNAWSRGALQRLNTHIDAARYPVQRAEVVVVERAP